MRTITFQKRHLKELRPPLLDMTLQCVSMCFLDGANVQIYAYNGTNAQQFWLYTKDYKDVYMWVRTA